MGFFFVLIGLVCLLAIPAFIVSCFEQLPVRHRALEQPWMAWLILVPIFAFIWNFRVFGGLSDSYERAFRERGDLTVGDCGKQQAMVISIGAILSVIPGVNFLAIPAVGFGMIAWLWKMNQLKQRYSATAPSTSSEAAYPIYPPHQVGATNPLSNFFQTVTAARQEIAASAAAKQASNPAASNSSGCGCVGLIIGILILLFVAYAAYKIVDVRREGNAYYHQRY